MELSEEARLLCSAWGVVLAHALMVTVGTWEDLRRVSSLTTNCLLASAALPGFVLFAESAIRYTIRDGELRVPEDLRMLGIACLGSAGGLVCIVAGACVTAERGSPAVWLARASWLLAWAVSSVVTCSMAVTV
jgi:hypothetical protein